MKRESFGRAPDGSVVERVEIAGGGLRASFLTWGAILQDLRFGDHEPPLVLGFPNLPDYLAHSPYFGATAGRYANRIAHGRFAIDGHHYQADTNFLGKHLLHGGAGGTGKRNWRIAGLADDRVTLMLSDPDGAMGFPGKCEISAEFVLAEAGRLEISYTATCDVPTLVNLAHHSYFNLDGCSDILDHEIMIEAGHYLPVDEELIPTGEIAPVAGTPFDFRKARSVRTANENGTLILDHNLCLGDARVARRRVASAHSRQSGITMTLETTEPGVQFYAGHKVGTPVNGLTGKRYGAFAGFCFEPQIWPDSPNHPQWPQAILLPGETYRQETVYAFSRG